MKLRFALLAAMFGSFAFGFASCGEADRLFDCQSVCNRYKTCFNSSYDVSQCRSNCKSKADADKTYEQKADDCENCIDDKSCSEATFKCAVPCAGIVP